MTIKWKDNDGKWKDFPMNALIGKSLSSAYWLFHNRNTLATDDEVVLCGTEELKDLYAKRGKRAYTFREAAKITGYNHDIVVNHPDMLFIELHNALKQSS